MGNRQQHSQMCKSASLPTVIVIGVVMVCALVIALPYALSWAGSQGATERIARRRATRTIVAQTPVIGTPAIGGTLNSQGDTIWPPQVIIVPGGGQTPTGPPEHVILRLQKAKEIYDSLAPRPWIITTGRGTPAKQCPHDKRGFEIDEASMDARWLIDNGVSPSHILPETASLETIGNAFFARVMHVDLLGVTRLTIINNWWHMTRTKDIFGHVFGIPPHPSSGPYVLTFVEVGDGLEPDVLAARLKKEEQSIPKFRLGGHWRSETSTLQALHRWMYSDHDSYSAKRLVGEGQDVPVDPVLAKSY